MSESESESEREAAKHRETGTVTVTETLVRQTDHRDTDTVTHTEKVSQRVHVRTDGGPPSRPPPWGSGEAPSNLASSLSCVCVFLFE